MESRGVRATMPMSVTCQKVNFALDRACRGFTLLEMLVVLLLGGLIAALAMPGLTGMVGSLQRSVERAAINDAVQALPLVVREHGRPVTLGSLPSEQAPPVFDELQSALREASARLVVSEDIFISAAGFCPFGGPVVLILQGAERHGAMAPPDCRIQWRSSNDSYASN